MYSALGTGISLRFWINNSGHILVASTCTLWPCVRAVVRVDGWCPIKDSWVRWILRPLGYLGSGQRAYSPCQGVGWPPLWAVCYHHSRYFFLTPYRLSQRNSYYSNPCLFPTATSPISGLAQYSLPGDGASLGGSASLLHDTLTWSLGKGLVS